MLTCIGGRKRQHDGQKTERQAEVFCESGGRSRYTLKIGRNCDSHRKATIGFALN
jgi:hypothetical protein